MLDVIWSRGLPLDRITTTDVWATDTISANLPPMEAFKGRMDQWIWDRYRIEVEHLHARNPDGSKKTYEQMFYHVPKRRSQIVQAERENRVKPGAILGFPDLWNPWCQAGLKRNASLQRTRIYQGVPWNHRSQLVPETQAGAGSTDFQLRFPRGAENSRSTKSELLFFDGPGTRGRKRNIVEYLGIAADEPKRFGQLSEKKRAPLVEFGIEEDLCGLYCQYNGILSPTYETSCRDGCWFCHNQGVKQLRLLRRNWPELWDLLLKWDKDSPVTFKADGHTVHDFDERFRLEDEKLIDPDKPFRWSMLDRDLQKSLF